MAKLSNPPTKCPSGSTRTLLLPLLLLLLQEGWYECSYVRMCAHAFCMDGKWHRPPAARVCVCASCIVFRGYMRVFYAYTPESVNNICECYFSVRVFSGVVAAVAAVGPRFVRCPFSLLLLSCVCVFVSDWRDIVIVGTDRRLWACAIQTKSAADRSRPIDSNVICEFPSNRRRLVSRSFGSVVPISDIQTEKNAYNGVLPDSVGTYAFIMSTGSSDFRWSKSLTSAFRPTHTHTPWAQ